MKKILLFVFVSAFTGCHLFAQQKMELVIPRGHTGNVKQLLFTKDNKYLLSGGGNLLNFYDVAQNKLLKSFNIEFSQLVFNEAQTKVLITGFKAIHILSIADFSLTEIKIEDADAAVFANNENYIYTAGRKGPFKVNITTGEKQLLFSTQFLELKNVRINKNGKTIYFGGENKMYAYDETTKTVTDEYPVNFLRDVLPNGILFSVGRTGKIGADGTFTKLAFYNSATMQEIFSKDVSAVSFGSYYNDNWWWFDEKNNWLLIAGEKELLQFNCNNNTLTTVANFPYQYVAALVGGNNGNTFYLGFGSLNDFLGVQKYSITQNTLIGSMVESVVMPLSIEPAKHNNGFVASNAAADKIKYFNVSASNQKVVIHSWGSNDKNRTTDANKDVDEDAMLSPNGKLLVAANNYKDLLVSNAESPAEYTYTKTSAGNYQSQQAIAFTADSKTIAIFYEKEINVTDATSKQNIRSITVPGNYVNSNHHIADILPNANVVFTTYDLTNTGKQHVAAIAVSTGLSVWDIELNGYISFVSLNEQGSKLLVAYNSLGGNSFPSLATINPLTGEIISTVTLSSRLATIKSMNYKKTLACTIGGLYGDGKSFVWNASTSEVVFELPEKVILMEFLKNDSLLIVSTEEGMKLYNIYTKKELAKIIMYANSDEYIIITPDGLFDGTEKAINAMYFVKNKEVIPLTSFFETYYTPNLLARILSGQPLPVVQNINELNIRPTIKMQYTQGTRNLGVEDDVATYQNTSGVAIITVSATAPADKVDEIRLFHNGKIVNLATRGLFVTDEAAASETKKYTINLLPGNNSFRALAINSQRTESKPDELVVVYASNNTTPAPAPSVIINNSVVDAIDKNATLHLMVVGIDKYQNKTMQLNYAMADAKAFKSAIEKDAASVISNIKTYLVYDEDANKSGITAAFSNVQKNAQPQDVFVFYYAGHGVISEKNKEFYLVPNDVTDLKNADAALKQNGIASKLIQQYAIDILAQKQLFILDACQSAGAFEQLVAADAGQQKNIANVARSTGTHWIAASGSQQYANEFSSLGHGAFTYVLLQALNGEAASNKMITVNGLKYFLQVQVPALMKKYNGAAQLPSSYGFGNDFPVEVIK